jgi:hypothetical protein
MPLTCCTDVGPKPLQNTVSIGASKLALGFHLVLFPGGVAMIFGDRANATEFRSIAMKAPIGTFVKDERIAGRFLAREHHSQNDIVIARLVHGGNPAAELSGGALQ